MVTFRAICCIHNSFGWMVIPAGGELTADFRLRFGNPARDAERQAASHHREHQNPHERIMQTVLERGLDHLVFAGNLLSGRILKQLVNAVERCSNPTADALKYDCSWY